MFILIGKIAYLFIWLFLLFNLVHPYPAPANIIAYVALATFMILHGLQACLLNATLTNHEKKQYPYRILKIFLFGIFEALSWKQNKQ